MLTSIISALHRGQAGHSAAEGPVLGRLPRISLPKCVQSGQTPKRLECAGYPHSSGSPVARIIRQERIGTLLRETGKMLATTGAALVGLGVLSVALEATWAAAVFGAVGMWMIGHAA